jgi:superoxide reductase
MTKLNQIYVCKVCGNIVQIIHAAAGELVCCGVAMVLQEERSEDQALEKHVPVIEKTDSGYKVVVGSAPHPMEPDHYIEWIELIADGISYRKYLHPGDKPEATFQIDANDVSAREFCNKHFLWKS